MRIGELSTRTGVSRRLLRYYEEQGLLRPGRSHNGYREYADTDVIAVQHIRSLLAAGLPTTVIAELLHCLHDDEHGSSTPSPCPGMVSRLLEQQRRLADSVSQLRVSQRALDSLLVAARRAG
jgi:DNA-binding transcriptional MerR regulator